MCLSCKNTEPAVHEAERARTGVDGKQDGRETGDKRCGFGKDGMMGMCAWAAITFSRSRELLSSVSFRVGSECESNFSSFSSTI